MTQTLSDRMKEYEKCYNFRIQKRIPIIIRVDGRKFSKLTKKFNIQKPFDTTFNNVMINTAKDVANEISGCVCSYIQSDEISFVVRTDSSLNFDPFFGNRIQKICSVTASMVTSYFMKHFLNNFSKSIILSFDARVYTLPNLSEVVNYLTWRQNDATRNSILNATYYEVSKTFGRKTTRSMMHGLKSKNLQELLFQKTGLNWNNYNERFKRGSLVKRLRNPTTSGWAEEACPIFSSDEGKIFLSGALNDNH